VVTEKNDRERPVVWIALGMIFLLGIFLRFYRLGAESLWLDELATWFQVLHSTFAETIKSSLSDTNPPAYYLLMTWVIRHLGDSEFVLRLPSAIAGSLCIPVGYFVGRSFYTWREGLIFCALIAALTPPVAYGQEARCYSIVLLLTLILAFIWRELIRKPSPLKASAFASISLVILYTHYFGIILVATFIAFLFALAIKKRSFNLLKITALMSVVIVLGYSPWLLQFLGQAWIPPFPILWIPKPTVWIISQTIFWAWGYSVPLFALVVLSLLNLLRTLFSKPHSIDRNQEWYTFSLLVLWFLVPFSFVILKSWISYSIFLHRYFLIIWPAMYLLVARGSVLQKKRSRDAFIAVAVWISFSCYQLMTNYYNPPQKEPWRQTALEIEKIAQKYGPLIVLSQYPEYFKYYLRNPETNADHPIYLYAWNDFEKVARLVKNQRAVGVWLIQRKTEAIDVPDSFLRNFSEVTLPSNEPIFKTYRLNNPLQ
jgi:mannosyltransferase